MPCSRSLPPALGALAALLALTLAACGSDAGPEGQPAAEAPDDGLVVLRRGNGSEPRTLDMAGVDETIGATILYDLYEGLTSTDLEGRLTAGAAERWEVSDDGLVYTFHLRPDGRWANGDPVVAADWVASLRRYVNPMTASPNAQFFFPLKNAKAIVDAELPPEALGVRAVDDLTLEVELEQPTPWLPDMFATRLGYPVHRPSLEEHGDTFARPGTLVGNGAYVLTEWVVQSHIKVERNPHYRDTGVEKPDVVFYYPTENVSSEFKRYRAGELDYTQQVPSQQYRWIRENMPEDLRQGPYLGVYFFFFDVTEPPFDDVRVRKALSMATDRETMTEKVLGMGQVPAYGFVPEWVSEYEGREYEWAEWSEEKRLAEARRLYAEAGYGPDNPLEFQVHYNTSENHKKVIVALASMWKEALGAEVSILNQEWKVLLSTRRDRSQWEMLRMGWIGGWDDPYPFLEILLSTSEFNDSGWTSAQYDESLFASSRIMNPDERAAALAEIEQELLDSYATLPLYYYVTNRVVKERVGGYQVNLLDRDPSRLYAFGMAP